MRVDANQSALNAIATRQQVTANNIANANTDEFKSSEVRLETGPDGYGVKVSEIRERSETGPLIQRTETYTSDGTPSSSYVQGSNTDYAREAVSMIQNEHAYAANAKAMQTQHEMLGTLINEVV